MKWDEGEGNNRMTMPIHDRTLWYTDSSQAAALALGAAALSLLALFYAMYVQACFMHSLLHLYIHLT